MPMNGFTVGRDISLQILGQNNAVVANFSLITKFDAKQQTNKVKIMGIDGVVRYLELPDGWEGSISLDRATSELDDYIAQLESNYYAGLTIGAAQITETITEVTGATTQFRYVGVMFKLDDAGSYAGDNKVSQMLSWCASKKLKIQ